MKKSTAVKLTLSAIFLALAVVVGFFISQMSQKNTYRLDYRTQVVKYSEEYELDPYLVSAIIHTESANDKKAVSRAGAVGLMQIMPDTGEWIAGKQKDDKFDLTDPDTNIRYGCWYLNFLLSRFESTPTAIAAYNAGHGIVKKWLQDDEYSDDGVTLKNIPYKETSAYVNKVQRAYEKYKKLYPKAFS